MNNFAGKAARASMEGARINNLKRITESKSYLRIDRKEIIIVTGASEHSVNDLNLFGRSESITDMKTELADGPGAPQQQNKW